MKLTDISPNENNEKGVYAAVTFDKRTVNALEKYVKDNKIPKANHDWHTTLLYSRKHLPNYEPEKKYSVPMIGTPVAIEIWDDTGKNVLVLRYQCSPLYQRHHKLMLQHGATYDFDEFKPHVTLSYDVGKMKIDDLPEFKKDIKIVGEYSEELDA